MFWVRSSPLPGCTPATLRLSGKWSSRTTTTSGILCLTHTLVCLFLLFFLYLSLSFSNSCQSVCLPLHVHYNSSELMRPSQSYAGVIRTRHISMCFLWAIFCNRQKQQNLYWTMSRSASQWSILHVCLYVIRIDINEVSCDILHLIELSLIKEPVNDNKLRCFEFQRSPLVFFLSQSTIDKLYMSSPCDVSCFILIYNWAGTCTLD